MVQERYIEDTVNDVKNIITFYFDSIDYTTYIVDLEESLEQVETLISVSNSDEEINRLLKLKERVLAYLSKTKDLQKKHSEKANESADCGLDK